MKIELRLLTDRGWITSEVQPGHPTVYRDAGRWVLRIVGEDTTATRGVGGGQREALGGATPNVGERKVDYCGPLG